MTEKHEIKFSTDRGVEITIETSDLSELSSLPWFKQVLGLSEDNVANPQPQTQSEAKDPRFDSLANQFEQIRKVVNQLVDIERQRSSEPKRTSPEPEQKDMQAREQMRRSRQQSNAAPQQGSAPKRPQQAEKDAEKKSYMDLTPDEMETEIWESLSAEQRARWQEKHMS